MSKQINQYTKTRTSGTVKDDDLLDFDSTEDSGSTFESAKITVLNFVNYLKTKIATFYAQDGTLTGDRTVSGATFWTKWIGGDVIVQTSNEADPNSFLLKSSGNIEKGKLGFDPIQASAILELQNAQGKFFEANNNEFKFNTDVLFVDSDNVGIGTTTPLAASKLEIETYAGSLNPLLMYKNRVGGGLNGDSQSLSFYFNDSLGVKTLANSIQARIGQAPTVGNVQSSLVLDNKIKISETGRVLVSESVTTLAPIAEFEVRGTTSIHINTVLIKSGGSTNAYNAMYVQNSDSKILFRIAADGAVHFNEQNLTSADFNIQGLTDNNLFHTDASEDNVGFGTSTPNSSAKVEINSTTQGFLPPRMTTVERDAISSPAAGLMIFNTTTSKMNFYNGSAWEEITSA